MAEIEAEIEPGRWRQLLCRWFNINPVAAQAAVAGALLEDCERRVSAPTPTPVPKGWDSVEGGARACDE